VDTPARAATSLMVATVPPFANSHPIL
jgi:hypothetical protein